MSYSLEEIREKVEDCKWSTVRHDASSYFYWRGWEEGLGGRHVSIRWSIKDDKERAELAAYEMGKADAKGYDG